MIRTVMNSRQNLIGAKAILPIVGNPSPWNLSRLMQFPMLAKLQPSLLETIASFVMCRLLIEDLPLNCERGFLAI